MSDTTTEITQTELKKLRAAQKAYKTLVTEKLEQEANDIEHREDLQEKATAAIKSDPQLIKTGRATLDQFYNEDNRFQAMRFVTWILKNHPETHIASPFTPRGGDTIYWYHKNTGVYEPTGIPKLEQLLQDILETDCTKHKQNEVIHQLRVATYVDRTRFFQQNPAHIILENGVYNIETETFSPHDSKYRALTRIPHRYNPEARCTNIVRTLVEIVGTDIAAFQEWLGYQLYRLYPIHKVALFIGSGKNGKTQILELIKRLVGAENTSSVSLYDITGDKFAVSELYGKHSNIAPDVGKEELRYTGRFKAVTGEDTVRAQEKYGQPFSFYNYAKMNFSCNQVPASPDNSDAFYRRFLCFKFRNKFMDRSEIAANPALRQDPTVKVKIPRVMDIVCSVEEMEGLILWALRGLRRLLRNGEFCNSQSTEEIREYYTLMSNPLLAFVKDNLVEDSEGFEQVDHVYNWYVKWCRENGFVVEAKSQFGAKLSGEIMFQKQRKRVGGDKARVACYVGISFVHGVHTVHTSSNLSRGKLCEYFSEKGVSRYGQGGQGGQDDGFPFDEEGLVREAVAILTLYKGRMLQRVFWGELDKRGYGGKAVSLVLRGKYSDRFIFMGLNVRLSGGGLQ